MPSHKGGKTGKVSRPRTPDDDGTGAETRAALVIGHPGHELCVYGWTAQLRPRVFVLTDGSGHSQKSRIEHTRRNLVRLGAAPGSFFGRFSDAAVYRALLHHDFALFAQLAVELAHTIIEDNLTCVVGDASEGYNPTHDACRLIINAAVKMARSRSGRDISNLEFVIAGQPNGRTELAARIHLSACTFEEKLHAARNYPGLKDDVEVLLRKYSEEAFRAEHLYPSLEGPPQSMNHRKPLYEKYGAQRVREGFYKNVITYDEHLLPLARSLAGEES